MGQGSKAMLLALALGLPASMALARDIVVSAQGAVAAATPDGSAQAPWPDLKAALKHAAEGDRILLRSGEYGALNLNGIRFDRPVTITSAPGGKAHFLSITVHRSAYLTFRDLEVWPLQPDAHSHLVTATHDADHIRFEVLDIRGAPDAPSKYRSWSKTDWTERWANGGVRLDGADNAVTGSSIIGTGFAIQATGPRVEVRNNLIRGFADDAMRGLGDDSVFSGNRIEDCVKVNDNHDDGFQSWARERDASGRKVVSGITIENNTIREWTGPADHPLWCALQGIGLFDGIYKDFTIRNNLIVVSAWHGISIYGGQNVQVVNNTVVAPGGVRGKKPWIRVSPSKSGVDPGGNLVANNVAMAYSYIPHAARMNVLALYPVRLFRDPAEGDFHPRPGGALVDSANSAFAPSMDIDGQPRPQGKGPDIGAYELP